MSDHSPQRKRRSASEWQQVLDACDASSLSQAAFCRQQGLALSTLQYWKRRLRDEQAAPASAAVIDLGVLRSSSDDAPAATPPGWSLELLLGHWLSLRLRRA